VKEVKLDMLFPDRGMQLHGHVRVSKMDVSFPDRRTRHRKSSKVLIINGLKINRTLFVKISPFPSLPKRGKCLPLKKGGQEGFSKMMFILL
jgi:hypothetical protein